ncbi:helix-turn-helix domain-containing protein [Streptomyces gibsoniae]|uniref:Helix-turn-helix transcriptional regulator n=1 Tax=Streptomyces gibsoniae TaxID=3075529 RepID=A0ABU2TXR9_9ACTN|nr:helix-turn-helix transcriptional regulator [Streptomyces sp. DSM 41699]MDT0465752.1 helix-turn-helix transcriptional regulator [Streptomyces sp. DSM 41699]
MSDDQAVGTGVPHIFGRQLKRLRTWAGMGRAELGARTGYSESTIASFEQGRRIPPRQFIGQADEVLDAHGVLLEFVEEMERAQYPPFFQDAAKLEKEAVALHVFAVQGVPGLLQTEGYARSVFNMWRPALDEETIEQRVAARLARQEIFTRKPMPTVSFVVEESVLRKRIGGESVARQQLEQILLVGRRRDVHLQVMPDDRDEHAAFGGPFTLIETMKGRRIAYVEAHTHSRLLTDRRTVRELEEQYSLLRAQALTPRESLAYVGKLLGET